MITGDILIFNFKIMKKTIPITLHFNPGIIIGKIEIEEKYLNKIPGMTLAPAIIKRDNGEKDIVELSLVYTKNYIEAFKYEHK